MAVCAAFLRESRMKFANATKPDRKSGVAQWRDLRFLFSTPGEKLVRLALQNLQINERTTSECRPRDTLTHRASFRLRPTKVHLLKGD